MCQLSQPIKPTFDNIGTVKSVKRLLDSEQDKLTSSHTYQNSEYI